MAIRITKTIILIFLVYLILKDIQYTKLLEAAASYQWKRYPFYLIFFYISSYLLLSYRWHILTHKKARLRYCYEALVVAEFFNTILPARLGELAKVVYLKALYQFKINSSLAILIIERLFDALMLATLGVIAVNLYIANPGLNFLFYGLIVVIWMTFFLVKYKSHYIVSAIEWVPFRFIRVHGKKIIKNINKLISPKIFMVTLMVTLALWGFSLMGSAVFLRYIVGFDLQISEILTVFIVAAVGRSVPLAPAGAGTFHAAYIMALGWFGIPKEDALVASIVAHFSSIVIDIIVAFCILHVKNISIDMLLHKNISPTEESS